MSESHKGKVRDESTKRKIKSTLIKYYQILEHRELRRKQRLNQIFPKKDTSIELKIQNELLIRNIPFQKHYSIIGQPDIAFPDKKIAIFCDGDYWHNLEKARIRDKQVNEKLRDKDWLVLRYWENEINANTEAVVDEIEEVIIWNLKIGKREELSINHLGNVRTAGLLNGKESTTRGTAQSVDGLVGNLDYMGWVHELENK